VLGFGAGVHGLSFSVYAKTFVRARVVPTFSCARSTFPGSLALILDCSKQYFSISAHLSASSPNSNDLPNTISCV